MINLESVFACADATTGAYFVASPKVTNLAEVF